MRNLPVSVAEDEIEDMFTTADTDKDGKIGYKVECLLNFFYIMIYLIGVSNDDKSTKTTRGPQAYKSPV